MTNEQKQLLLKDLCARLPYNPIINCEDSDTKYKCFLTTDMLNEMRLGTEYYEYKPYLRPMSSITEKEAQDMFNIMHPDSKAVVSEVLSDRIRYIVSGNKTFNHFVLFFNNVSSLEQLDWLNKHHFDYRGLIEKGLALEAPEGMYKSE